MKPDGLDSILAAYGKTLVRIWLSLWGEPLLNKNLPSMIAACKKFDIWVLISTNASVPLSEAAIERIVLSGLDSIVFSIDGATQATYAENRKGGNLDLVLQNVRRFVAAKKRLNSQTPQLLWRYLEFPWNRHEIAAARALAADLQLDEFQVQPGVITPQIKHSKTPRPENERASSQPQDISDVWQELSTEKARQFGYFGCDYLYSSISINSNGLVHPCCYVVSPAHAVGNAAQPVDAVRNGKIMRGNRRMFAAKALNPTARVKGSSPCLSCPVMESTHGHVVTQSHFMHTLAYLMEGRPMRW
jgi:MoaA/NifB/PqqE/SkfB family radical SAM enzyme